MDTRLRHVLFLLALALSWQAAAQSVSMRPRLVALQVENLDASIRWYTTHLEFLPKDRKDFPDHGLKLAILSLGDFDLELVENAKTLKRSQVLAGKDNDITGFAKVTFVVPDVRKLFQQLEAKGAQFAIRLRDSNSSAAEQFFVVLDNEKNWLQFVGRK
jgi:catechol 2,3-dioxygenase-like lactoylglutathione lyase family enzyme